MECEKCTNEHRISFLENDLERNSNQHREFYELFKSFEIKSAVSETNTKLILQAINELKLDVKELKSQPSSYWKIAIAAIIVAAITAACTQFIGA